MDSIVRIASNTSHNQTRFKVNGNLKNCSYSNILELISSRTFLIS